MSRAESGAGAFAGRVVLITGAAGALGKAATAYFAAEGARLALLDVVAIDGTHFAQTCDLTDAQQCKTAVDAVVARLGTIDVLVNIAGGFAMGEAVHETTAATWDFLMGLNAHSVLNMARATVPVMLAAGRGKIVNIGAGAGQHAGARMGAYSASKSVVIRLTEAMAGELKAQGINVNCVLPSIIDTPRNRADMPDADYSTWVQPGALARVIGFLASDAAAPIHGAALPVTGLV
jgi:NAD(P)-dependent dehydrogenase (short-subunit alcohol dehydrogenase family)